jgi:hypothetical protein
VGVFSFIDKFINIGLVLFGILVNPPTSLALFVNNNDSSARHFSTQKNSLSVQHHEVQASDLQQQQINRVLVAMVDRRRPKTS